MQNDVKGSQLPRFPTKDHHTGARVAAGMFLAPMAIFALWEMFSAGSPVLEAILNISRVCYFIVVVLLATVAFGWYQKE
jgi:hypothetical protein